MHADWLIENINLATLQDTADVPYGAIYDGLIAIQGGKITWLGARHDAPVFSRFERYDGQGGWITPGLIDCHTHIVYGGQRAQEFEQRLNGATYEDIARQGGGIINTVNATRNSTTDALRHAALQRLTRLHEEGVTCVEIKSGYGLDLDTEIRLLEIAKSLADSLTITIKTTYLGAHTLPPEYKNRADDYINFICQDVLPIIANKGLADAVDVFCENIGFSLQHCKQVFDTARSLGINIKAHAEQLSYQGGARLVADYKGLSADHLEYLAEEDIALLKQNNVVAVLLPAAYYYLQQTQPPPIHAMRQQGLAMAVASDSNPGSAPTTSLLTTMNQACILFGLTPEEALLGTTRHGAAALGLQGQKGQLKQNYDADLLLWDIDHPAELSYSINSHRPKAIWVGGNHA